MRVKDLNCHRINCPDELMQLCDRYTPYESMGTPRLCDYEDLQELDIERDIKKIEKVVKSWNLAEWEQDEDGNSYLVEEYLEEKGKE